jgi:hypothetical protein
MSANNKHTANIVLICCIATIGGFLFGVNSGVINDRVGRKPFLFVDSIDMPVPLGMLVVG